ncbi:hypothetical protein HY408_00960 [Candidatus Gottesmanbacteria bacterium]|nr:hypothetical protein [Candidatus Gottesmanbacteria bacterium]
MREDPKTLTEIVGASDLPPRVDQLPIWKAPFTTDGLPKPWSLTMCLEYAAGEKIDLRTPVPDMNRVTWMDEPSLRSPIPQACIIWDRKKVGVPTETRVKIYDDTGKRLRYRANFACLAAEPPVMIYEEVHEYPQGLTDQRLFIVYGETGRVDVINRYATNEFGSIEERRDFRLNSRGYGLTVRTFVGYGLAIKARDPRIVSPSQLDQIIEKGVLEKTLEYNGIDPHTITVSDLHSASYGLLQREFEIKSGKG